MNSSVLSAPVRYALTVYRGLSLVRADVALGGPGTTCLKIARPEVASAGTFIRCRLEGGDQSAR